jgi:HK97 family phage major capsid protein
MKATALKKLLALLAIKEADRTADQAKEYADLAKEAQTHKIELTLAAVKTALESADSSETTDDELATLISGAVEKALKEANIDQAEVTKAIKDAIKSHGGEALTAEKVEEIVKSHLGGAAIDQKALVDSIKASIPQDAMTSKDLAKALDEFAKSIRQPSRMVFDDPYARDFPIEHRSGNLSVSEKQLLNICLAHVSDEKKSEMKEKGIKVPTKMNDGISDEQLARAKHLGEVHQKRARHQSIYGGKGLTTGSAGSGFELIPSDLSGELMTRLYLESQLAAEFVSSEVDMPTNPFMFPLTTTRTNFYTGSEAPGSDPTQSTPGTDDITLNATKLIGLSEYSYEADEDSIIAVLPMLLENMSSGAADALEGAIINGDITATHQDSDIHAVAGHHAKLFRGLRKHCIAGVSRLITTGGLSAANIAAMRKQMGKYGIRPRDLMLVVGPAGYNKIVTLDETLTFEKVGNTAAARILTGEAASIYGIRIVVSSQVREDLNATGVYDGTTTTNGSALLVHRPSWLQGVRRGFTVEVDVDKKRQINSVIASFRRAFVCKEPTAPTVAIPTAVLAYGYVA